jgi:hypothetical protein
MKGEGASAFYATLEFTRFCPAYESSRAHLILGRQDGADSASQSEAMTVAVGFVCV